MVHKFIPKELRENRQYTSSFKRLYLFGLRFDLKIIAIILSPFLLFGISTLFIHHSLMIYSLLTYITIISFLALAILIGNIYYYQTYNNHYDIFIFGLIEDDTKAIIKNIYDDYPVVYFIIITTLISLLFWGINFSILNYGYHLGWKPYLTYIVLPLIISMLFLLARGTLRSEPLGRNHARVSNHTLINKMVPNGIIAMQWAFTDKKQQIRFIHVEKEEGNKLIKSVFNAESLIKKTDKNDYLAQNKPHVVFSLMESFGFNLLAYDDPHRNDLLGKLRPYFHQEFLFKRFLAEYVGTASTVSNLFFNSPIENISQSIAQKTALPFSTYLTYKKQGYRTIFITSGNMMWRNLGNYFLKQGVDEVYDQNSLIDAFPEAKISQSYWGVADEYAFKFAEKQLIESDSPVFISILSMTNHPPYQIPQTYHPKNLSPSLLRGKYGNNDKERYNTLATYQYACNALGEFFDRLTQGPLQDRIILAATGDHHVRSLREEMPKELFLSNSVPFLIYLPETLKKHFPIYFDENRIGSHKDIMPTLFSVSLSEAEYWTVGGRNMFSLQDEEEYAFAVTPWAWADRSGVIDLTRENPIKYLWQNDYCIDIKNVLATTPEEKQKIKDYQQLLRWQINYLVQCGENAQS
ncbi:LTA synthase family protein [Rodentibacter heidelbergensis]|uniref:Sulfatase n=1 Tax=Rodentibacter heidelbergensis TaxID=1908258 RepID=A0A1V3I8X9_9PAST|nr:alkaline phosphatase family protein [Rodentibacter heidelbergensis]OOF36261.1 sulfatase [Rodentibacter heidelbergensis]